MGCQHGERAVVFRNWTAGELLPQMREYFLYADESVGLAMQKTSTCALFLHPASHCCQKAP